MLKDKKWIFIGVSVGLLGMVVIIIWANLNIKDVCIEEEISIQALFCPSDNCSLVVSELFSSAKEIRCAFYDLDEEIWEQFIMGRDGNMDKAMIVMEDSNCLKHEAISCEYSCNQMHNKFCVFDNEVVLTGSLNPTLNGFFKNNNNIIIVNSSCVAREYLKEYRELEKGVFSGGKKGNYNVVRIGDKDMAEFYFCPEDDCRMRILELLQRAEKEVCFSLFALTDDEVSDELVNLRKRGIWVYGTIEDRNRNLLGSDYEMLSEIIDIRRDGNNHSMHHKFFVVDNKTVITGSANPSENGFENNDENIIIIHNSQLAESYNKECRIIFSKGI